MRISVFLLTLLLSLFCASNVYAVTLSIDSYPSNVTSSEFEVGVTIVGAKTATNYLKVLLYSESPQSSVSETWNGTAWYAGTNTKEYFPISITEKTSTTTVKARCTEGVSGGKYFLSVKRYTASGSPADDEVSPVTVTVENSTTPVPSTPVPTPNRTPVVSVTPHPTVHAEMVTPAPTPIVTATAAPTNSVSVSPQPEVLAVVDEPGETPKEETVQEEPPVELPSTPVTLFLLFAFVFLVMSVPCFVLGISGIIKAFPHENPRRFI